MKGINIKRVPFEEFLKNPNSVDIKELQNKEPFQIVKEFLEKVYDIEVTDYVEYYFETEKVLGINVPKALVIKYR